MLRNPCLRPHSEENYLCSGRRPTVVLVCQTFMYHYVQRTHLRQLYPHRSELHPAGTLSLSFAPPVVYWPLCQASNVLDSAETQPIKVDMTGGIVDLAPLARTPQLAENKFAVGHTHVLTKKQVSDFVLRKGPEPLLLILGWGVHELRSMHTGNWSSTE